MIRTNIRIGKYSNIFEYPNIRHTMFQIDIMTFAKTAANKVILLVFLTSDFFGKQFKFFPFFASFCAKKLDGWRRGKLSGLLSDAVSADH